MNEADRILAPGHPPEFVGRSAELCHLHTLLHAQRRSVLVVGPAGIGKTSLVTEYVRQHGDSYSAVSFLQARRYSTLAPGSAVGRVLSSVADSRLEPRLLVVDGLDEAGAHCDTGLLLHDALGARPVEQLLMTSRTLPALFLGRTDPAVLNLRGLSAADAGLLLRSRGLTDREAAISCVHARFAGHPLALRLFSEGMKYSSERAMEKALEEAYRKQWGQYLSNVLVLPTETGLRAIPVFRDSSARVATPSEQSVAAAPYVKVRAHAHFWREQLERFDDLLNDPSSKERHFQEFFEQNSHFLLGLDYKRVIPHPVLVRESEGPLIPDFFLQLLDDRFCDILDLKSPSAPIVAGTENRLRYACSVQDAIAQLREYHSYFDNPEYREAVRTRYGATAYKPALAVVIGRTPRHISPEKQRWIAGGAPGIRVTTYDELRCRMERLFECMSL